MTGRPAPDDVSIRPARKADCRAMGRMGASLARAHHAWDPERFFIWDDIEKGYGWWLGREISNRRAVVLVAVRGRSVIGYAYGRIEPRDWNSLRDRCGVGIDLVVMPGSRGVGVGRLLGEALFDALARKGAPRVIIQTAVRNRDARRLFRRMGFRPTVVEMAREVRRANGRKPVLRRPRRRT